MTEVDLFPNLGVFSRGLQLKEGIYLRVVACCVAPEANQFHTYL